MKWTPLPLLALSALTSLAAAQTFEVPGDFSDLQEALDAVPSGATIEVHGGHWFELRIEKPVTLIGTTTPTIWGDGAGPLNYAPITLDGPGSGDVVLRNFHVGAAAHSPTFLTTEPGILGSGFDGLYIYDSQVNAPFWDNVYNTIRGGSDAIRVNLPLVWIERSTVLGGDTVADANDFYEVGYDAGHGIVTTGTVVLIDSSARGGYGANAYHLQAACGGTCPDSDGGHGVVCDTLLHATSSAWGGSPSSWSDFDGTFCCNGVEGLPVIANHIEVVPAAVASLRTAGNNVSSYTAALPVLGEDWTAQVDLGQTGHDWAVILFHGTSASIPLASGAFLLIGDPFIAQSPLLAGPAASFTAAIPPDPALSGFEVFSQAAHLGGVTPLALTNALDLVLGTD